MVLLLFNNYYKNNSVAGQQANHSALKRKEIVHRIRKTLSFNFLVPLLVLCQHDVCVLCSVLFQLLLWL